MDRHGATIGEQQNQTDCFDQHQEKPVCVNKSQAELSTKAEYNHGSSSAHSTVVDTVDLTSQSSEVFIGGLVAVSSASQLDDTVPVFLSTEDVISFAPSTSTPVSENYVQHTEPSSFDAGYQLLTVGITLHRVNLLEEMICQFKDEMILNYPLKYSFINEKGTDADGVARDVYAAFWREFLDCAAEGGK